MKVPRVPRRLLGLISAVGAVVGLLPLIPVLLQGSYFRAIDQLALLSVLSLYCYGIWLGVQAFRPSPSWERHALLFWLVQAPAVSSSLATFMVSTGMGLWVYVRFGAAGLGGGTQALLGSVYQWSYMQPKAEIQLGVNVVAVVLAGWLAMAVKARGSASLGSRAALYLSADRSEK